MPRYPDPFHELELLRIYTERLQIALRLACKNDTEKVNYYIEQAAILKNPKLWKLEDKEEATNDNQND